MLLIPQPRWYEQMILLGSKGSRRHPQGTCEQGRTSAFSLGWRGLGTKKKKNTSSCAEVCVQKLEIPINLLYTPWALQKMWGFAGMSARQGISTPPFQVVM